MNVGLFIPCYIDQFYPQVGMAVVEVLRRFGVDVTFPPAQTCCGQPMANTGCVDDAKPLALKFLAIFREFDYVVCPSGSCTAMVRLHYDEFLKGQEGFDQLKSKTYELSEFLTDVLKVEKITGRFPHKVGIHQSCHGLRELRLGKSSELMVEGFSKVRRLLESLQDIELVPLARADECCGFGGTFAVGEEAVSCMMGNDRIHDHETAGAEVITGADMSCLMHLEGLIRRQGKPLRVMHLAEILVASGDAETSS
ncbi:MAG: (Fe-S)-binding protein [Planctomycetales bacterium]|nr:(Fe-S)-binding protein [Planctomycetales bacterium]NIM09838.1 (Fe-S)-binding protein [Planctomycetales bacterium]NIN09682.1 (Fe-S)-binding protein [Planctomycetales bacterium]NIN78797.1 (Fe-S)-binding protein [Planctomycetales bacterium]NIO35973.1 (Fe-S)-binding protein [Planctomycetales bacterium]